MKRNNILTQIGSVVGIILTVIAGLAILSFLIYPHILDHFVKYSDETLVFGVRCILITALWFVFGHNKLTQAVSDIEKSGPTALVVIGIVLGIFFEGLKLVGILEKSGFGALDVVILVLGVLAIPAAAVWAYLLYTRRNNVP